ncbi:MAG: hypothetical protein PHY31_01650 [Smithellaceae bacterium]|nr:hypothetical protein [Smithellaceae bacterium]
MPELEAGNGIPDVRILSGETPREIRGSVVKREGYQLAPGRFLFCVSKVGRYYVTDGERIVVEPSAGADAAEIRLFLLGTAFGVLLLQRGILPMHGSALVLNAQGIILTGSAGAGKSTLLAALKRNGAPFLADDVSAVSIDEERVPWIQPAYPQQKLWRDSAMNIGVDISGCPSILARIDKFSVSIEEGFCRTPVRLTAVCELRAEYRPEAVMMQLTGPDKIAVLLRHTYRQSLVAGLGLKGEHFESCATIARQIGVYRLLRPSGKFTLVEQMRLVKRLMAELVSGQNT